MSILMLSYSTFLVSCEHLRVLTTSYGCLDIILLYLFGVRRYEHLRFFDDILWVLRHHLTLPLWCSWCEHLRFFDDILSSKLELENVVSFLQCLSSLSRLVALLFLLDFEEVLLKFFWRVSTIIWLAVMFICVQPCSFDPSLRV